MPSSLLRRPSAFLPVAMSLAALVIVLIYLAANGPAPQADEGTAARLWQILMLGQLPIVLYFGFKWVPRAPRQAVVVLVLQAAAGLAALAPVLLLHW